MKLGCFYSQSAYSMNETISPWQLTPYHNKYNLEQKEAALFLQDFMDYGFFEVNAGLRINTFRNNLTESNREAEIDPRISITQKVTDFLSFSINYGKFTNNKSAGLYADVLQRLTRYRAGMKMSFGYGMSFHLADWYNNYTNTIYRNIENQPYAFSTGDKIITENPIGKGMDFHFKWNGNRGRLLFQYSLSWLTEKYLPPWSGYLPADSLRTYKKEEFYLPADRRHDFLLMLSYKPEYVSEFKLFGFHPLQNMRVDLVSIASSGFPYTPPLDSVYVKPYSKRAPWYFSTNLSIKKPFCFGTIRFEWGLMVKNLFDHKNAIEVYNKTGNAEEPGEEIEDLYSETLYDRPSMYGRRREIDFFLSVSF